MCCGWRAQCRTQFSALRKREKFYKHVGGRHGHSKRMREGELEGHLR